MLKMMTYQEANNILYTKLTPDERCIRRGIGEDHGAVFTEFLNRNTPQGQDPNVLFPSSRLMPVEALENEPQPSSCFLPFDEMSYYMGGYEGDNHAGVASSHTGYDRYRPDQISAGWVYNVDRIIIGDRVYPGNKTMTESSTQSVFTDADWLSVELVPEPTQRPIDVYHDGTDAAAAGKDGSTCHFTLVRHILTWEGIRYHVKSQSADSDYRTAKIIIKATKNQSMYSDLQAAAATYNSTHSDDSTFVAEDVCPTFVINFRQKAGQNGDNGDGEILAVVENVTEGGSVTLTCNSASSELDLAVYGTGSSGGNGYWSSIAGQEVVNIDTTPIDFTNVITVGGSGNSKTITISPSVLNQAWQQTSSEYVDIYVVATWSKCANSVNNMPPQPIIGSCTVGVTATDAITQYSGPFSVNVKSASALNFINPANLNQIEERGSTILHIRYRAAGTGTQSNPNRLVVKRVDVPYEYYTTYIKPVLYITNFVWPSSNADTSRNYTAKSATINTTETVNYYSRVNGANASVYISMCDVHGNSLTSDNSTYTITSGSSNYTINKNQGCRIKSGSSFTISFDNVSDQNPSFTKYFKIEQEKTSEVPSKSENMSPEYAIIGFTFNE